MWKRICKTANNVVRRYFRSVLRVSPDFKGSERMVTRLLAWPSPIICLVLLSETGIQSRFQGLGFLCLQSPLDLCSGKSLHLEAVHGVYCAPLPKEMRSIADALIKLYPKELANKLPPERKTAQDITAWFFSHKPPAGAAVGQWSPFECYGYKDYLFLTIKVDPNQKKGDPKNLGHCIVVDLRQLTYILILYGRT